MRLRRKNTDEPTEVVEVVDDVEPAAPPAPAGPVDASELDRDAVFIDLGSLLVQPTDLDLRLQVDEETGSVLSVLMVAEEGILEMRAFASSRGGDLWADVRREIAADSAQRGGTATEQEGPFGTELYCEVPVTGPDGEQFVQPSRVIGCTGPRWFLRATIAGRPAQDAEYAAPFEEAVRSLAVRRGNEAMAPGEPLPLRLPPEARPQTVEEAAAEAAD
ncbi:DUF3710 domain-containing protein [Nocardioides marmoriginsengisoli]|uniref:DUF3710 domain-containing protein n=1 Tax=Nocardioides marmoriginsengisoli TaxID=661483 RepID=A0A3N0CN30_9ACTN|nr:DUF3710 domain-containing protein [Nocardioides marmoriginsengisoli]RNL64867.1 DUF3710 domain-containing protein [Nocardioides marmoriginsengisoli]